jgi:hypothetical protein
MIQVANCAKGAIVLLVVAASVGGCAGHVGILGAMDSRADQEQIAVVDTTDAVLGFIQIGMPENIAKTIATGAGFLLIRTNTVRFYTDVTISSPADYYLFYSEELPLVWPVTSREYTIEVGIRGGTVNFVQSYVLGKSV